MKKQKIIEKLKALIEELEAPETFESIVKDAKKTGVKRPPQQKKPTFDWVQLLTLKELQLTEKAGCFDVMYYSSAGAQLYDEGKISSVWFPLSQVRYFNINTRQDAIDVFGFDPYPKNYDQTLNILFVPKWLVTAKIKELNDGDTLETVYDFAFEDFVERKAQKLNKMTELEEALK